jgi:hypothetical protein
VQGLTRADLLSFQKSRLRPSGALLVVAGDITMGDVKRLAARAFAGWTGAAPTTVASVAPPARAKREIVLVHRPGSVQSNIVVGNTTFGPADPRFYATTVANKVLGGGADSRLFLILREQKSWTYGAYSNLDRPRGVGAFQATAEVRTEVTDSALTEMLSQLRRLGREPVPAAELEAAKGALVGSFPLTIETADQVAGAVSRAKLLGLPADYLQTYRPRLAAITPAQLQQAARATIRPDAALIVVVGDGSKIYDGLAKIAPVRVVSVDGTPIAPSELKASASASAARLDLDLSKLVARQDSFAVMVQGNALGFQRMALEKNASGFRYTSDLQIATAVKQSLDMALNDRMDMQAIHITGTVQGQPIKTDVTFAGGRATGSATAPSKEGIKTTAVDVAVPSGAVNDAGLNAILPALRWTPRAKFGVNLFSASKNSVVPGTLAVSGTEKVTVPAGTFDVYKADLTGGDQPVTLYVTTAAPNRLVKMAIVGTPIVVVLVK